MFMFIINSRYVYHYYYHSSSLILSFNVHHSDLICFWFGLFGIHHHSNWNVKFIEHYHSLSITQHHIYLTIVNNHWPSQPKPWRYQFPFLFLSLLLFLFSLVFVFLILIFMDIHLLFDCSNRLFFEIFIVLLVLYFHNNAHLYLLRNRIHIHLHPLPCFIKSRFKLCQLQ